MGETTAPTAADHAPPDRLEYEGSNIAFDPYFDALGDISKAPDTSTRDNLTPLNLSWEDLSFSVPVGDKKSKSKKATEDDTQEKQSPEVDPRQAASARAAGTGRSDHKQILRSISGYARCGQMLAIMGASGAGKSSLLNLLAGRVTNTPGSEVTGTVHVNGKARDFERFKKLSAYVLQDDDMFGELTVREQLMYTARLRLPSSMSNDRKKLRVEKVIQELGLSKVADSLIGNETIRGVSGGERKRVSIGTELVTDSSLLFLDEPTSGLDAFNALNVMSTLRTLASNGRTIVSTIHQPRSSIFQLFDMLLLLSEGRTVYFGPASEAISYFDKLRFPSPESFNPSDFFLDLVSVDPRSRDLENDSVARIQYLADSYEEHAVDEKLHPTKYDDSFVVHSGDADGAGAGSSKEFERGWINEFRILASRAVRITSRAMVTNGVRLFQTVFFSLVLGLIWLNNGRDEDETAARLSLLGVLFFVCINQAFVGVFAVIFDYPMEQSVVTRERASASYRTSSYYLSKISVDIPKTAFFNLLFTLIAYFMVGFDSSFRAFAKFWIVVFLVSQFGESLALSVSILTGNAQTSAALAPVIIITSTLFGGFFIDSSLIPDWIEWIKWVSFVFYSFNAFAKNEFGETSSIIGLNGMTYWENVAALAGIVLFLKFAGFLALKFLRGPKFLAF